MNASDKPNPLVNGWRRRTWLAYRPDSYYGRHFSKFIEYAGIDFTQMRTVITLDGLAIESDEPFMSVHRHMALDRVGIADTSFGSAQYSDPNCN